MMKSLILLAVIACYAYAAIPSQERIVDFLKYHNNIRKEAGASNMRELKWDPVLAQAANQWGEKCAAERGIPEGFKTGYEFVGQNMFLMYCPVRIANVTGGLNEWYGGKESYDVATAKCTDFFCRNYLQMVSAECESVGCAEVVCPAMSVHGSPRPVSGSLVFCNYGNHERGKTPFKVGSACSECPAGYECKDGLCYKP